MTKRVLLAALLAVYAIAFACADRRNTTARSVPKGSREFLLARGFKPMTKHPDILVLEKVRLADAARDLGFSLEALRPVLSQSYDSDVRTVVVKGVYYIVRSEVRDENGRIIARSLDNPDAICTVTAPLYYAERKSYLQAEGPPKLHIQTVTVPRDRWQPLQVVFELAAPGKTPLAVPRREFHVRLSTPERRRDYVYRVSLPRGTPEVVKVFPGKPIVFTADVLNETSSDVAWNRLPAGHYGVRVGIQASDKEYRFDYQWIGGTWSDRYEITLP